MLMEKGCLTTSQMFLNGSVERKSGWNLSGSRDLLVVLMVAGSREQMLSKLTISTTETSQQTEAGVVAKGEA